MLDALTIQDAAAGAAMSAQFGWPHRPEDWTWFLRLGHGVAWRENGRLAGTAMWFPLDEAHASIGLVQVAPDMQGRGLGRRLMHAVIDAAGDRSLMLHATPEGAALYASLGFKPGAGVQQWQGMVTPPECRSAGIRMATANDHAAIARLDHEATGLQRCAALAALLGDGVIVVAEADSKMTGFAVRRSFGRGGLIGPIVAPDIAIAEALAGSLATPGFQRMDLAGPALSAFARDRGLSCVGEVMAMSTGDWPAPAGPAVRLAVASQALG